jgi:hypothetical protein
VRVRAGVALTQRARPAAAWLATDLARALLGLVANGWFRRIRAWPLLLQR